MKKTRVFGTSILYAQKVSSQLEGRCQGNRKQKIGTSPPKEVKEEEDEIEEVHFFFFNTF